TSGPPSPPVPHSTKGAGPSPSFRTRDRSGALGISLTRPLRAFQSQACIKRVRRSGEATEPGSQAPPRQLSRFSHRPPDPSAEPHGPRRALRSPQQSPAPAGGSAAPAPSGLWTARSRWVPSSWGPRVGRCWGGRPAPTAPLNQRVCSSLGAPVATELRCQCLQTLQGIHPKNIQSVIVKAPGPHCAETEVIATLKNGQKACLNPASPMVQKIIEKILNK
uniref:C-X-C motif chemokine n=1 Tax=Macaca fascicularis TaxID=9541 RepID=A0A7N9CCU6_MACFA